MGSGNVAVEPTVTAGTTSQYYRGDKTFQTLDKTAVGLGNVDNTSDVNKPVSTAQATAIGLKEDTANKSTSTSDSASSVKFPVWTAVVSYVNGLGYQTLAQVNALLATFKTTNFLDATSSIQTQINSKATGTGTASGTNTGDETLASIQAKLVSTSNLAEGSNLYFTTARVLATVLSGLSLATGGAIVSTDTVLQAFGKIQKQINDLGTIYQAILTDVNFGAFVNSNSAKTTVIDADLTNIVDTADSNKSKKVTWLNIWTNYIKVKADALYQVILTDVNFGTFINSLTDKSTPVDADTTNISDSSDSNKAKKTTLLNLWTNYFKVKADALYVAGSATIKKVYVTTVASATVTGTTAETLIVSLPVIPGGTFTTNDFLAFQILVGKSMTNACTIRVKASNINLYSGALQIATFSSTTAFVFNIIRQNLFFKADNTLNGQTFTTSLQSDYGVTIGAGLSSVALNPANPIYLFISVQPSSVADVVLISNIKVTN